MKQFVYLFGMRTDIKLFVQHCKTCKLAETNPQKNQGYLQIFTLNEPFEMVAIDIVGALPVTRRRNRCILTIIDGFTRFV